MRITSFSSSLENFWNLTIEDALKDLSCSNNGLSNLEAVHRLKQSICY